MVRARALGLWREVERPRLVQPDDNTAPGVSNSSPSVTMRLPSKQSHAYHSSVQCEDIRHKEKWEAQTGHKEIFFHPEDSHALNCIDQGGCAGFIWRFSRPENPEQPDLITQLTLFGAEGWTRDLLRSLPTSTIHATIHFACSPCSQCSLFLYMSIKHEPTLKGNRTPVPPPPSKAPPRSSPTTHSAEVCSHW